MARESWLVVGLGNPGKTYDRTWHNVGRMAVDRLAQSHGIPVKRRRFRGLTGDGLIGGTRVRFLQPNTYMNLSGESLVRAMAFEKIPVSRIIILYDDFDLPLGRIRIRDQGSGGSHKGMKSNLNHLKNDRFLRIRIGIGPPPPGDIIDFVLSKIPSQATAQLDLAIEDACQAVELIISGQLQAAQESYNKKG